MNKPCETDLEATMTDNPLVEDVARQVAENDAPPSTNAQTWADGRWAAYAVDVAATLRAIEDAGYKIIVDTDKPSAKPTP